MAVESSSDRNLIVQSLLQGGRYGSVEEVMDEALQLLAERDDREKLDRLRTEIALGIEEADRGELDRFDPNATLARIRSEQTPDNGRS